MNYIEAILKAINYIEDHMFEDDMYENIFTVVNISKYHFHRIFLAGTHETIGNYIKKRRFTIIAEKLRNSNDKIIDIALYCKYSSHEGFSRAFKNYFSVSPKEYRMGYEDNPLLKLKRINREFLEFNRVNIDLAPKIQMCKEMTITGKCGYTNLEDIRLDIIWHEFFSTIKNEDIKLNDQYAYTVWVESVEDPRLVSSKHNYNVFVGFNNPKLKQDNKSLETINIAKGLYAIFTFKGDFKHIYRVYSFIYFVWLVKSQYTLGDNYVIEAYNRDFSYENNKGTMSILIPIKKSNDYQETNR